MRKITLALTLLLFTTSCNLAGRTPLSPVVSVAVPTPTEPLPLPTPTETIPPPTPTLLPQPEEAILILEPGPGSRLLSPIHVSGSAASTFEQGLVIRIVLDDGSEVARMPATIMAEIGDRGPFQADIPVDVVGERQAFIQVYSTSARDGGLTHLTSVGVVIADSGATDIRPNPPHAERLFILIPGLNEDISGGVAHIEGYGLASFEQTLVAEVIDAAGNLVGSQTLIVNSPEWGQPGPFSVDVPYRVESSGPGRILVRDPSVVIEGSVHLASVEVMLNP